MIKGKVVYHRTTESLEICTLSQCVDASLSLKKEAEGGIKQATNSLLDFIQNYAYQFTAKINLLGFQLLIYQRCTIPLMFYV